MSILRIVCDGCGKDFIGAPRDPVTGKLRPNGYSWGFRTAIRAEAKRAGWTTGVVEGSETDYCPDCSQQ